MSKHIIDRRQNPKGKSTGNRQRFLKRSKKYISDHIREKVLRRSISDKDGEEISIPLGDLDEPEFHHDGQTGDYDRVLPGNDKYVVGDSIPKPQGGGGDGGQGDASDSGEGEDNFVFSISREEYLDIVFEDLELPNMTKKTAKDSVATENERSGFVNEGNPAQLDLVHSMRNSLGRRIALGRRKRSEEIEELMGQLMEEKDHGKRKIIEEKIYALKSKLKAVPYIDPVDLRFRNYAKVPKPRTSALMICLMDVSASMGEYEKDLAKRFYTLLYLFLERKYQKVEIVFVRHHTSAKEVTEEEFFNDKETGGTMVSTGLEVVKEVMDRYDWESWNMYVAQTSDGDNFGHDTPKVLEMLTDTFLPALNHYFYIEVMNRWQAFNNYGVTTTSDLWGTYANLAMQFDNLTAAKVATPEDIVPVFRDIFAKESDDE